MRDGTLCELDKFVEERMGVIFSGRYDISQRPVASVMVCTKIGSNRRMVGTRIGRKTLRQR